MKKLFVLVLMAATMLVACKKEELPSPSVTISISGEQPFNTNFAIQFHANISYTETISWNFGDGSTSTEQSPTHEYATGGTYTVSCTVTGNGKTATDNETVVVVSKYNKIKRITINSYPTPYYWDNNGLPDLYVVVRDVNDNIICSTKNSVAIDAYFPCWWTWESFVQLPNVYDNYRLYIELRDDDGNNTYNLISTAGVTVNGNEPVVSGDDFGDYSVTVNLIK